MAKAKSTSSNQFQPKPKSGTTRYKKFNNKHKSSKAFYRGQGR